MCDGCFRSRDIGNRCSVASVFSDYWACVYNYGRVGMNWPSELKAACIKRCGDKMKPCWDVKRIVAPLELGVWMPCEACKAVVEEERQGKKDE